MDGRRVTSPGAGEVVDVMMIDDTHVAAAGRKLGLLVL